MVTQVYGKIGSVREWEKIYNFHYFPLVQQLTNGGLDAEAVYCETGCEKCPYCAVYPWQGFMGMHFCLLCFMETKEILELGKGLNFDGQGCEGRHQKSRIPRKKRKQLFRRLRAKTGNRHGPYKIIRTRPYDPFTSLIKDDVGRIVSILSQRIEVLKTKADKPERKH